MVPEKPLIDPRSSRTWTRRSTTRQSRSQLTDRQLQAASRRRSFAVVIPAYNEATELAVCLRHVVHERPDEIVVVDGGSGDETAAVAVAAGVRVIDAGRPRRSRQMDLGAACCRADVLMFVCADSRLRPGTLAAVDRVLAARPALVGGSLSLRLRRDDGRESDSDDRGTVVLRCLAWAANVYCRLTRTLMCDRLVFVRREELERLGGFLDLPVMEDVDLGRRLRAVGETAVLRTPAVSSSGRRFQGPGGPVVALRVLIACLAFACGVSSHAVAQLLYRPLGGPTDGVDPRSTDPKTAQRGSR